MVMFLSVVPEARSKIPKISQPTAPPPTHRLLSMDKCHQSPASMVGLQADKGCQATSLPRDCATGFVDASRGGCLIDFQFASRFYRVCSLREFLRLFLIVLFSTRLCLLPVNLLSTHITARYFPSKVTMPPKKEPVISAFERKRLENIANNNAILSGISSTADKIIPTKPPPSKPRSRAAPAPRVKREPVKQESVQPTRRSGRLAGIGADDETLKRKLEVEAEAENEKAKAKKMRVSGDLKLGDIGVEGRKWENGVDGLSLLKGLSVRGAQPGVRTFTDDDVEATTDKGLKDLRLRMGALKLYEKWSVNGWFPHHHHLIAPNTDQLQISR